MQIFRRETLRKTLTGIICCCSLCFLIKENKFYFTRYVLMLMLNGTCVDVDA